MAAKYEPGVRDLLEALREGEIARLLLLGADEIVGLPVGDVRWERPPGPILPNGLYFFGGADAMLVAGGLQPAEADQVQGEVGADHPLRQAYGWYKTFWDRARQVGPQARFAAGDYACMAGTSAVGRIEAVLRREGANLYRIRIDGVPKSITEEALRPFDLDDDPQGWVAQDPAGAKELAAGLTITKLTNPLTDTVYSYLSSKTVFRPYQFRPVMRLLSSTHQRLLIADEVGLGKTIEAGLVWNELDARSDRMHRVLIVCPSMLVPKWRAEMRRRFDRDLDELDAKGLANLVEMLRLGDEHKVVHAIVSLERLRSARILADLAELNPRFDLVIVDEAHYLRNRTTASNALGRLLSDWADTLIFLSATPLNLGNDDLFNLLNLLVEEEFGDRAIFPKQVEPNRYLTAAAKRLLVARDDPRSVLAVLEGMRACELGSVVTGRPEYSELCALLDRLGPLDWHEVAQGKRLLAELNTLSSVLTRTRKVDVPDAKAVREPHEVDVVWTDNERRFYEAVLSWARARAAGGPVGWVTQMPLRQAASCLPAMRQRMLVRDPSLLIEGSDDLDDLAGLDEGDEGADSALIHDRSIRSAMEALGDTDSKYDAFAAHLREIRASRPTSQLLVFSFFRGTIAYLLLRLRAEGLRVRSMDGSTPYDERQEIMNRFRAGQFDILLASEVASEGLDFEFCDTLVNYDLPWNPMRIEQRIGRLDRFGQLHEKIFILNFHVPGTIETDILQRLYARIEVFTHSVGELEPILRDELVTVTKLVLDPSLTDDQRRHRLDEIAVAVEAKRQQLDDIKEASGLLAGLDAVLIDGLEHELREHGRFIDPSELLRLIELFFTELGAGKVVPLEGGRFEVHGDPAVADLVARQGTSGGSSLRVPELAARLRDEAPIQLTLDNDDASRHGSDLLSLRHPLVRAAVHYLSARPKGHRRFTSVRVPTLPRGSRFLTVLYLAESTGLRPTLELWPVSIDLGRDRIDDEVGFQLIAAAATGRLEDGAPPTESLTVPLSRVSDHALDLQVRAERTLRMANEALVAARISTQTASFGGKIQRAEETLRLVERERRGQQIQRLHRGRIAGLRQRLAEATSRLEAGRDTAMTVRPVAVVVMTR